MAIKLGNVEPVNFMLGNKQVERICQGEEVVWQRGLIEGVDYQRYEWLYGDEYAYIDTMLIPHFGDIINAKFKIYKKPNINNQIITTRSLIQYPSFGISTGGQWVNNIAVQILVFQTQRSEPAPTTYAYLYRYSNGIIKYDATFDVTFIISNTVYKVNMSSNITGFIEDKQTRNFINDIPNSTFKIGFYSGLESSAVKNINISNHSFYPCKLLKDVPCNTSSDKKKHYVGECGMINISNGIFYGNTNTTGSFTVSN